jgi:hypothetical protein
MKHRFFTRGDIIQQEDDCQLSLGDGEKSWRQVWFKALGFKT